jgi:hypothetical protein
MSPRVIVTLFLLIYLSCLGLISIQPAAAVYAHAQPQAIAPGQETAYPATRNPAPTRSPFPTPTELDSIPSGFTTYQDPYNLFFVSIPEYARKRPGDRPAIFQIDNHSSLMFFEKKYLAPPLKENLEDLANGILFVRIIQEGTGDQFKIQSSSLLKDDLNIKASYFLKGDHKGDIRLVIKKVGTVALGILLITSDFPSIESTWDTVLRTYKLVASISTPLPASSDLVRLTTSAGGLKTLPDEVRDLFPVPQGEYFHVEDFDQSLAQRGGYKTMGTGRFPSDFVLRAKVTWWNAPGSVSWNKAGCGFIFRYNDKKNFYSLNWALDGNAYLERNSKGETTPIFYGYFTGRNQSHGEGTLLMSVVGSQVASFFNGKRVLRAVDLPLTGSLKDGEIALAVFSGTNADYGTRCKMTDIELWEVERP